MACRLLSQICGRDPVSSGDTYLATYGAIAAIGEAIVGLLEQACPHPEFDGAVFRLYRAIDFKTPMDEGISLFLYRVATSSSRRNLPPRIDAEGRRWRSPLPVDLYYLLTPWGRSAERQHRLLGFAMRTLEDTPTLNASFLNHYSRPDWSFMPDETLTVVFEPLNVQDSATYVVRLLPIESLARDPAVPPAQTRDLRPGKRVE
jgi:hypothetical protein